MANYANVTSNFIAMSSSSIKQQILLTNPVPENLNKAKKLEEFVKDILKENDKKMRIRMQRSKESYANINVMGPLSKLWLLIQNALSSQE